MSSINCQVLTTKGISCKMRSTEIENGIYYCTLHWNMKKKDALDRSIQIKEEQRLLDRRTDEEFHRRWRERINQVFVDYEQGILSQWQEFANEINQIEGFQTTQKDDFVWDDSKKIKKWEKESECPICSDSLDDEDTPLRCGHWAHHKCIINWAFVAKKHPTCPICRTRIG